MHSILLHAVIRSNRIKRSRSSLLLLPLEAHLHNVEGIVRQRRADALRYHNLVVIEPQARHRLGVVGAPVGIVAWLAANVSLALILGTWADSGAIEMGMPRLIAIHAFVVLGVPGPVASWWGPCPARRALSLPLLTVLPFAPGNTE